MTYIDLYHSASTSDFACGVLRKLQQEMPWVSPQERRAMSHVV